MQKRVRSLQKRWQRSLIIALLFISTVVNAKAERNNLKPTDFEPLTGLPWKKPGATLNGVLDAIFREPDYFIRYGVLAEYLRILPVAELGRAFDLCIALEGAQTPDRLVDFFLRIWATRDPETGAQGATNERIRRGLVRHVRIVAGKFRGFLRGSRSWSSGARSTSGRLRATAWIFCFVPTTRRAKICSNFLAVRMDTRTTQ